MTELEKVDRQFQKIHAIAFGKWLSNNQWQGDFGTWFKETQEPITVGDRDGYVAGYITSTTEELYNEFIKSV